MKNDQEIFRGLQIMRNGYRTCIKLLVSALTFLWGHAAIADVIDGYVFVASSYGTTSTDIVTNASVDYFDAYENSTVQVTGGDINWLTLHDQSSASVSSGNIGWLVVYDNSSVRITGVDRLDWLVLGGANSHVDIVADNVQYSGGKLSGIWGDGRYFNFWAQTEGSMPGDIMPANILVSPVPETDNVWLFAVGILTLISYTHIRQRGA